MNLLRRMSVVALAGALVAGAGCGSASPSAATIKFPKQAVAAGATSEEEGSGSATTASTAKVDYGDTVTIDRSEFERELKALNDNKPLQQASGGQGLSGAGKKTVDPRLAAGWLTFIIQDKLITHEFDRRHLKVTPADTEEAKAQLTSQYGSEETVKAFPTWFQDRLVERNARAVALRGALSGVDFSEDNLRKYFEAHKADFSENCVSHILVKTKPEADAVLARLKGGEDFGAVAKQVSIDKGSAAKGGDLDCSPKGAFVPEFDQAASELPVGQLSDPVQTQYGFHILKVRERKDATFESAQEQVRALLNADTQTAFRNFLRQALTSARITVDKRYGTFEPPATGQAPVVVPPAAPKPKTQRSDNTPTTAPLPGELPGSPGNPTQPVG
ncbi:MAG TPA: peptidylprolyl isomerase [Acidimicrobiia bacterium]|nr:peptidylprolyl isomerase [Acidimicrobiia bacterium]